jgi:dTDP-4-dehydrorhamnose reductase
MAPDRLRAYGETILAFADKVDSATARTLVERTVSAISETEDPDQLRAYGETIRAFADKVDSATARTLVERTISAIAETRDHDQLQAYAQIITALRKVLSQEELIVVATEFLKYPFAAIGQTTNILKQAVGTIVPAGADSNLWEFVVHLGKHHPWIRFSRSWQGADAVIADLRQLLNHGPPLPHASSPASRPIPPLAT